MWLFSKFHLLQIRVPDTYYAKTKISLSNLEENVNLMLMTLLNSANVFDHRRKCHLCFQTLLVFTRSPDGRVEC
jgi:hypothetical protein